MLADDLKRAVETAVMRVADRALPWAKVGYALSKKRTEGLKTCDSVEFAHVLARYLWSNPGVLDNHELFNLNLYGLIKEIRSAVLRLHRRGLLKRTTESFTLITVKDTLTKRVVQWYEPLGLLDAMASAAETPEERTQRAAHHRPPQPPR